MCGVVGIIDTSDVVPRIISGLRSLEYRGYDSSGIGVLNESGSIEVLRVVGKIDDLYMGVESNPLVAKIAIGHTRWATHGLVRIENAHPHYTHAAAIVHNGIVENHHELRVKMIDCGYKFYSQSDSEVIAVLITYYIDSGLNHRNAFRSAISEIQGSSAVVAIFAGNVNLIAAARFGSPMVIGKTFTNGLCVASDQLALNGIANKICHLRDDEYVFLDMGDGIDIRKIGGESIKRDFIPLESGASIFSGDHAYTSFMLKEMYEQPHVINNILSEYIRHDTKEIDFPRMNVDLSKIKKIHIIGCGTSYYAGLTAAYEFKKYCSIDVTIDIASEFGYRSIKIDDRDSELFLFISQSGYTSDTISVLKFIKSYNGIVISILNAEHTTMEFESDGVIMCNAGPEIGVASTKSFTCQLTILLLLVLKLARIHETISTAEYLLIIHAFKEVGDKIADLLKDDFISQIESIASDISSKQSILYIGKYQGYGIAMEGALKMKELSYIHAEAIASGELKHGSIALIDSDMVTIANTAISNEHLGKIISNIEEIVARDGKIIIVGDHFVRSKISSHIKNNDNHKFIEVQYIHHFVSPILQVVPLQLLAYHVAFMLKRNIDKPRNLAKSVTVE